MLEKVKQQAKSKTMIAAAVLASIESAAASLTYLEPVLSEEQFALISAIVAFSSPIVMAVMRQVTTEPISNK